jgi:dTDP-4-dehydrorhamnose reductase
MNKLKILVTGGNGLVGSRFVELYNKNYEIFTPDLPDFDITDEGSVYKTINKINPDWIVNFAAFTDVNAAELQVRDESSLAWKVNVDGLKNLTNAFLSDNIIQISTDMVFSGTLEKPGPYVEEAKAEIDKNKLTWYGWTKNQAEKIIANHGGSILRITYPVRAAFDGKLDYIKSNLQKFVDGKLFPLFDDQHLCISYIDEVSDTINAIIEKDARGIYHCASDSTTPYELITYTLDQLLVDPASVKSGSIVEFLKTQPNPYRYPQWGGLQSTFTESELDLHFSTWQTVVERLIAQGLSLPAKQN